jgi:hypothetical protein
MSCYGSTLAHLFTVNSISKLRTPLLASAVMGDTTAAFQFALSNICCWPRRAGRTITTEREAATATKSTFNDTELLHEPKKHIQYRWKGMNKKRRKKDEARGTWSRACALHRGPAGAALALLSSESFVLSTSTGVYYFLCHFAFIACWMGWEACTRCFAGPSNRVGPPCRLRFRVHWGGVWKREEGRGKKRWGDAEGIRSELPSCQYTVSNLKRVYEFNNQKKHVKCLPSFASLQLH